eukprot:2341344-Pyramimonas_sp.AAC.1
MYASKGFTRRQASQERETFRENMAPSVVGRQGLAIGLARPHNPAWLHVPTKGRRNRPELPGASDALDGVPKASVPDRCSRVRVHVTGQPVALPSLYPSSQGRSLARWADKAQVALVAQVVLQHLRRLHVPGNASEREPRATSGPLALAQLMGTTRSRSAV